MPTLISLYFSNLNLSIPLLHRPLFEDCVRQRLHIHNAGFSSILLLVCALGSLYVPDSTLSSREREAQGWMWYNQVELCGHSLRHQPTLYDIQAYCVGRLSFHVLSSYLVPARRPIPLVYLQSSLLLVDRRIWAAAYSGHRCSSPKSRHHCRRGARETCSVASYNLSVMLMKLTYQIRILILFDAQLSASLGRAPALGPIE
jgi:hypothetical protein